MWSLAALPGQSFQGSQAACTFVWGCGLGLGPREGKREKSLLKSKVDRKVKMMAGVQRSENLSPGLSELLGWLQHSIWVEVLSP